MITISPEKEDDGIWTSYTYNFTKAERKKAKKVRLQPKSEKKQSTPLEEMLKIPKTPTRTIKSEYKFEENKGKQPENEVNKLQPPREMFQIPKNSNKKNEIDIYEDNLQELNNYLKSNPIAVPSIKKEVKSMRKLVGNDFPIIKAALDFQMKRLKNKKSVVNNSPSIEKVYNNGKETYGQIFVITIDKKTKKINRFPREARLLICNYVFESLFHKVFKDTEIINEVINLLETQKIPIDPYKSNPPYKELGEISEKLKDSAYRKAIIDYIKDLISIMQDLYKENKSYNDTSEPLIVRFFVSDLWEKGVTLGRTKESLEILIRDIIQFLKDKNPNFKIENMQQQSLFKDDKRRLKECGRCHELLPFNKFEEYRGESRKGLRSVCYKCRLELGKAYSVIISLKIKLRLVLELGGTCLNCGLDMSELPALDFHHPDPHKKTYTWNEARTRGDRFETALARLKKDGVVVMCRNCHKTIRTTTFSKYKNLILHRDLFKHDAETINNMIEKYLNGLTLQEKNYLRRDIKRFIRKRFVIEQLYEGKCVGRGIVNVQKNLPALEFHHRKNIKDKSRWHDIADSDCEDIMKTFVREDIVCLCANDHRILGSTFHKYIPEIFENEGFSIDDIETIERKALNNYSTINTNVNKFKFTLKETDFKSPLNLFEFKPEDAWKLRLLQFFYILQKLRIKSFRREDFREFEHINLRTVTEWITKLEDMGFIKPVEPITSQYIYYEITEQGKEMVRNIEEEHPKESLKEQNRIFSYNVSENAGKRPLRHEVFMKFYENPNLNFNDFYSLFFCQFSRKRVNWYFNEAMRWYRENYL